MQTQAFVRLLSDNRIVVFSLNDAVKILHTSRPYTSLFLQRCVAKGLISRVENGLYYRNRGANEYMIASRILSPSYVSMISALSYYGLTTQIPNKVYVVSTKKHRPIKDVMGLTIVFKTTNRRMMFGYHKESYGNISIADPEKAIVDVFYFNDVNDLDEDALRPPPRVDPDKLATYAIQTGKESVKRRVARLLEENGYSKQARSLAKRLAVI